MTGFGRARGQLSDRFGVSVVVRSVNHRYLDIQVRTNLREEVPELEALARSVISERVQRGRVTAQLNFELSGGAGPRVTVNVEQVQTVLEQLATVPTPEHVSPAVNLGDLLGVPGMVTVNTPEAILDDRETKALRSVLTDATDAFVEMRAGEGHRLEAQILEEVGRVTEFVDWFEPQMPELRRMVMTRAKDRIAELAEGAADGERLVTEAAVLADRADVAEEVTRLRAHFESLGERLKAGGTVGRTLDFLCQEIHRELNTLGSKCREPGVAERLVEAKSAGERVREQVQNLE
jgi:uncharacterized protein (TIGR00255 family)